MQAAIGDLDEIIINLNCKQYTYRNYQVFFTTFIKTKRQICLGKTQSDVNLGLLLLDLKIIKRELGAEGIPVLSRPINLSC